MSMGRVGVVLLLATAACEKAKDPAPAKHGDPAFAADAAPPAPTDKAPTDAAPAAGDGLGIPTEMLDNRCVGYTPDGAVAVIQSYSSTKGEGDTVRLAAFAAAGKPPFEPVEVNFADEVEPDDAPMVTTAQATEVWTKSAAAARAWIATAKLEPCASLVVRQAEADLEDQDNPDTPKGGWPITVGGTAVKIDDGRARLTVAVGGGKPRKVAALEQNEGAGDASLELIRALYWHDKSPLLVVIVDNSIMGESNNTAHATLIR